MMDNISVNHTDEKDYYRLVDDCLASSMLKEFSHLRNNKEFCDITIKIESYNFPAHRIVLYCMSPYFKALLKSQLAESNKNEIEIKGFDPDIFEYILNFAYSGFIIIKIEIAISLLIAANHFQVWVLRNGLADTAFLEDNISVSNCLELYRLASMFFCLKLKEKCKTYILKNFANLRKQKEFLYLSSELLINLTSSHDLILDEESVFIAIYDWYTFDIDNRKGKFLKVFKTVRLNLLSPYFIVDMAEKYPAISNFEEVLELIRETLYSLWLPNRPTKILIKENIVRKMEFDQSGLAMMENELWFIADKQNIWQYNIRLNEWQILKQMLFITCTPALTHYNGYLYAVGCNSAEDKQGYIERYDWKNKQWCCVCKFETCNVKVDSFAAVDFEGVLYIQEGKSCFLHIYDIETQVHDNAIGNSEKECAALCSTDSYIYIIGAKKRHGVRYHVHTRKWESIAPMSISRSLPGVAVRDGKIYVHGGGHETVEVYVPWRNVWSVCEYPYSAEWPMSFPILEAHGALA